MANQETEILNKLYRVALSKVYRLEVKQDPKEGYIKYGKKNDYPEYLLGLAENQAEHGAILKKKAEYITGHGIESDDPRIQAWLKKANQNESWDKVFNKADKDKPIFGAYALKIIPNILGMPLLKYHLDYGKLRISNCMKYAIYSDDWSDKESEKLWYPIWYKGCREVSIYIHKDYFPTTKKIKAAYGHPEYHSVLTDIDTEVRVSTFFNVLVQNNFNPGVLVTIFKNNPTKEEKAYVAENLKNENTGEETAGNTLITYTDQEGKAADVKQINGNDLDKQYQEVGKRNQGKIIIAHGINPVLAGLQTDGKLGLTQELQQSHELFINGYAKPNQQAKLDTLVLFSTIELGFDTTGLFRIKQLHLIDNELPLDNQNVINAIGTEAFSDYVYKRFNIKKPLPVQALDPSGKPLPVEASAANDHIKDMSRSQLNKVLAVVRDFEKGRVTETMAMILLKGNGLTDSDAREFLGLNTPVKMSAEKSKIFLSLLNKYAVDINFDDEILETEYVNESTVKLSEVKFKNGQTLTKNQLRNGILQQLKKNPKATSEDLAAEFGIEVSEVEQATTWLLNKELIKPNGKGFDFTDRSFNRDNGTVTEVYTEYNYGLREGVTGDVILETTRQDCRDWYELYAKGKKTIPYEAIIKLTNEFGENAFDFSGGFWHNPKTGRTEPRCRHGWNAVTKTRNVRK